ncbi:MAG: YbjN domain-containing protein [Clostridiales bacterium]|nr:YbjN domain-containing protein [Clostridiales bacterium]
MNRAAQSYINVLKENGLKVKETFETSDGQTVVKCGWNLANTTIDVLVAFEDNCKYAALRCFRIARAPEARLGQVLLTCNDLNKYYKWVKFYLDDDDTVTGEIDAILDAATCGAVCFELMIRMTKIVDDAYSKLMKAIYA